MKTFHIVIALLALSLSHHSAYPAALPGIPEFIDSMVVKHQFKRDELETAFSRAQHLPTVIEAISRPATLKPWPEYRAAFVNPERVRYGVDFWRKHRASLQKAERVYGVPQEVIVAVIGVETVFGRDTGKYRVLDSLTTLAFDYPRRSDFFRSELENYLLLARDDQYNLLDVRGSYAGAMGLPQFMPSSHRKYAVDFNGNRRIDLLGEPDDAIGSVANYLRGYGWISGKTIAVRALAGQHNGTGADPAQRTVADWVAARVEPVASVPQAEIARLTEFTIEDGKEYWLVFGNFDVITRYNNSDFYAMTVFQLAEALKEAGKSSKLK